MENKEFVFVLTHSYDAIERAAAALQLATNMAAFDATIDFFLMNEGVHLPVRVLWSRSRGRRDFHLLRNS
jgi:predicted peroxiredoxin